MTVEPGKVANVAIELKPVEVKTEITVSASPAEVIGKTSNQTLSSSTVRDTPNHNERTEGVLPLIPGVVRGLDDRINIKGARSAQSGALVNSANVTDPATGNPALDVPIDVVASVQVISNPYDPQYGKFTGAVSTVDTKTSDYGELAVRVFRRETSSFFDTLLNRSPLLHKRRKRTLTIAPKQRMGQLYE